MRDLLDFNDPVSLSVFVAYLSDKSREAKEQKNAALREQWNNLDSDLSRKMFIQAHGTDWQKD